jgi:hypothetical protein
MQPLNTDEDVLTWPCPSLGLRRVSENSRMDLASHWPGQVQCALDRLYRRRVPLAADRTPGQAPDQTMNLRSHRGPARASDARAPACDLVDVDAALPKDPFPHV